MPPLRLSWESVLPMTEHEVQLLLRRPHLSTLLYDEHHRRMLAVEEPAAIPGGQAASAGAAAASNAAEAWVVEDDDGAFQADVSVLGDVTPDEDDSDMDED